MLISVYSQRDQIAVHDLTARVFSKKERSQRALIRLFGFWGIAVLSILIPVFHFVLVPLFVLLGPYIAYKTAQEEVTLDPCEIPSPECGGHAAFTKNSGQWPLYNTCPHCLHRIYFTPR